MVDGVVFEFEGVEWREGAHERFPLPTVGEVGETGRERIRDIGEVTDEGR